MILKLNIKPNKFTGRTKADVLARIPVGSFVIGTHGTYHKKSERGLASEEGTAFVYTLQKIRRKVCRSGHKFKSVKGFKVQKSIELRSASWICNLYMIPEAVLRVAKLKVEQGNRTFTIKPKSK